jgi:hypothetical protein
MHRAFVALTWIFLPLLVQAQERLGQPSAWETCIFVEGKGDSCRTADKARKFEDYLRIDWTLDPVDGFTLNAGFNLIKPAEHKIQAKWQEVGKLGPSTIRKIIYVVDDVPTANSVIIAERNDGRWIPLMKAAGDFPQPSIFRGGAVLATSMDFGGNIPQVAAWAWVWNGQAPMMIEVFNAIGDAVQKVAPGWGCYSTDMDWQMLHILTWCWQGEWRDKPSVRHEMNAWFKLENGKLLPERVVLSPIDLPGEQTKYWP